MSADTINNLIDLKNVFNLAILLETNIADFMDSS